jgi:superfamily I DNA/RNA helicase
VKTPKIHSITELELIIALDKGERFTRTTKALNRTIALLRQRISILESSLTLTDQQQEILTEIAKNSFTNHLMIVARAGTAKTTMIELSSRVIDPSLSVCAVAFNSGTAKELGSKLPESWTCKTTHSIGYGALRERFNRKLQVVKNKNYVIVDKIPDSDLFPDFVRALAISKAWGIAPKGAQLSPISLIPDEPNTYHELFSEYSIDVGFCEDPIGLLRQALLNSITAAWQGDIDFDDMLYLPIIYKADFPRFDRVFIDEAQDLNPCQRAMIHLLLSTGARMMGVGDDKQAIYGFRGADRKSLTKIIEEFSCQVLYLTTSFRCSQSVILEAQKIVPDIQSWPQSPPGLVIGSVSEDWSVDYIPKGSAILCRNNAPLMTMCLALLSKGVGATILGRDISMSLKKMVKSYKTQDLRTLNSLMWADVEKQILHLETNRKFRQANLLKDKAECISVLINSLPESAKVRDLERKLKAMFSDKKAVVTLATIHKAKGMEFTDVYILEPDLIPSKWATGEEEIAQEDNLLYVARTRAKLNLTYITLEDI